MFGQRRKSSLVPARDALSETLVAAGLVAEDVLAQARQVAQIAGRPLARTLIDMGVLSDDQLYAAYADLTGLPLWNGRGKVIEDPPFPPDFLLVNRILPVDWEDRRTFVIADAEDDGLIDMLRQLDGEALIALYPEDELAFRIQQAFELEEDTGDALSTAGDEVEHLKDLALEAPVIRQVNDIILGGIKLGASDIHLEPFRGKVALRYRVDGVLHTRPAPGVDEYPAVISRLKILSDLDIAERRLPQDGRFKIKSGGKDVDVRVSTIPSSFGEDVVLRLLDQKKQLLTLEASGLAPQVARSFRDVLGRSHGLVLVTGPTGSGKTTTLYSGLRDIVDGEKKIVTVEDPVEYEIPGITQVQVHSDIGLTFASTLRSMLRHDPDVILVGEIRDTETAEIAVQAALTGHLVLSTVHTNDAVSAIGRMLNMGVADFLLANSLLAVTGQRLIRRLCPSCKRPAAVPDHLRARPEVAAAMAEGQTFFDAPGCEECGGTGYRGRGPITEFLEITGRIREIVLQTPTNDAIMAAARETGFRTMMEHGVAQAAAGQTTLHEVHRVVG
jgi:general secretion pathway protein E